MNAYHKRFLESFASENVIGLFSRYRGAAKELTESWGILEAAKKFIPHLNEHLVVVVGDGCSPRTGALFAYFTKAEVISVDPNFNIPHWNGHFEKQKNMGYEPQRLKVIKEKIEDVVIDCKEKPVVLIGPHSHADMEKVNLTNCTKRIDIAMPCCVPIPRSFLTRPHIHYVDYHVMSTKREIFIWNS